MGSDKVNRFPTPTDDAAGKTQMLANLQHLQDIKNSSASYADDAEYVAAQAHAYLTAVTVS